MFSTQIKIKILTMNLSQHSTTRTINILNILLTSAGIVLIAIGFYTKSKLVNGSCCDMTYSRPSFAPIQMKDELKSFEHPSHYKLYKFRDLRDPRSDFIRSDGNGDQCGSNPGYPVLFIPGHWGFYEQARSIGAHGIGMTEKSKAYNFEKLYRRYIDESVNSTEFMSQKHVGDRFLYDVYTIDFGNEASAIHGSLMHSQSLFVNSAVQTILGLCNHIDTDVSVTLVGHSIGGIVARASVVLYDDEKKNPVRTIITLASPHQGLPYSFDSSIDSFFHKINQKWIEKQNIVQDIVMISISGGQRDELIRQNLSHCNGLHKSCISVFAADISQLNPPLDGLVEGIDHRAICWCHNLLKTIRDIIESSSKHENTRYDIHNRLRQLRHILSIDENGIETFSYFRSAIKQEKELKDSIGLIAFMGLQVAMPFSSELLIVIFLYTSIKYQIHQSIFKSPMVFLRFIFPLFVASQLFGVPWYALIPIGVGAFTAHYLLSTILSVIDQIKSRFRTKDSIEDILCSPLPRLTRVCGLILISSASFALMLMIVSSIVFNIVSFTLVTFKAFLFLTQSLILIVLWLVLLFKPLSHSRICKKTSIAAEIHFVALSIYRHIICIYLSIPFAFAGKIAYAWSLVSSDSGISTTYALTDLGDELLQASLLVALPLNCLLFIVLTYPFGLSSCVHIAYEFYLLDSDKDDALKKAFRDRYLLIVSKHTRLCDVIVSVLTIASFRLGSGHMISFTLSAYAILQILSMFMFVHTTSVERRKAS